MRDQAIITNCYGNAYIVWLICRLGKKATEHISTLTRFAKQVIEVYKDQIKTSSDAKTTKMLEDMSTNEIEKVLK